MSVSDWGWRAEPACGAGRPHFLSFHPFVAMLGDRLDQDQSMSLVVFDLTGPNWMSQDGIFGRGGILAICKISHKDSVLLGS